jgi:hypothetical protein
MKTKWFTLGAAAAMLSSTPALASEGHQHDGSDAHQCACGGAAMHGDASMAGHGAAAPEPSYGKQREGRKVEVSVTKDGFVPAEIPAKNGEVLNLVVTRRVERTCATELVQKEQGIYAPLPFGKPVTVTLEAPRDGQLRFSCAHGHIAGAVVAQ